MRSNDPESNRKRRRRQRCVILLAILAFIGVQWVRSWTTGSGVQALGAYPYRDFKNDTLKVVSCNSENGESAGFETEFRRLLAEQEPDIVFLQEATPEMEFNDSFWGGHFVSTHRVRGKVRTGVATLSAVAPDSSKGVHSSVNEGFMLTPRASLLTEYPLPNGQRLLTINIHGLATPPAKLLEMQLEELEANIRNHEGPVILAGNLNTWNQGRLEHVREVVERVGLIELEDFPEGRSTADAGLITPALALVGFDSSMPVDRVFYRELEVLEALVGQGFRTSDHAPLIVTFRMP